ncbi:toll/interleukin-1 receptor domain-containing protein [Pseudenhygromyxa sp. WMMC2535]|uniref:toll/interleukin-1 receptor domain-containing protein n=1 Tax=Pseudenhygromyxa sp. WMMC2535 TaxID=2712867 RepID=UPI001557B8EB|nr:toll/interleukin-1 receptor domain-containing protein [Pseudenhygromyxa sp. WMMC2535]NVB39265.1 toll/interleukin-1 receptor domain-containing protein [Pseudenhygromyxa sp. WMMC2535]
MARVDVVPGVTLRIEPELAGGALRLRWRGQLVDALELVGRGPVDISISDFWAQSLRWEVSVSQGRRESSGCVVTVDVPRGGSLELEVRAHPVGERGRGLVARLPLRASPGESAPQPKGPPLPGEVVRGGRGAPPAPASSPPVRTRDGNKSESFVPGGPSGPSERPEPSPVRAPAEPGDDIESALAPLEDDEDDADALEASHGEEADAPALTEEVHSVELGASAPARVRPGDEFIARFVVYSEELEGRLAAELERRSADATHRLALARTRWSVGTEVSVELRMRDLEVEDAVQRFRWSGGFEIVEFSVYVPADLAPCKRLLKFDARVAGLPVGRVRVELEVVSATATTDPEVLASARGEAFRSAFASYAHGDRARVLDRVASLKSVDVEVFLDCLDLRPGEEFEARIYDEILNRDLYLLFWSRAAARSKWVEREWRLAWAEKDRESFKISPLEWAEPPAELCHLNFNDPLNQWREGLEGLEGLEDQEP